MMGWLRRRREKRLEIEAEARGLLVKYGADALGIARERMVAAAFAGDDDGNARWCRIRQAIRRELGICDDHVDTATRYLESR